jgi:hypothetical protein
MLRTKCPVLFLMIGRLCLSGFPLTTRRMILVAAVSGLNFLSACCHPKSAESVSQLHA